MARRSSQIVNDNDTLVVYTEIFQGDVCFQIPEELNESYWKCEF